MENKFNPWMMASAIGLAGIAVWPQAAVAQTLDPELAEADSPSETVTASQRAQVASPRPLAQPETVEMFATAKPQPRWAETQPHPVLEALTPNPGDTPAILADRPNQTSESVAMAQALDPEPSPAAAMVTPGTPETAEASDVLASEAKVDAAVESSAPSMAQADTEATADADQIRQELRVDPLPGVLPVTRSYPPSPNAGIPSAFGAEWGDLFISASLAGADRLRPEADGSLSMGFGLGNARSLVGLELSYNLLSIRRFGENGNFDAKLHRELLATDRTEVAVALGVKNFARYGSDTVGTEASPYGAASAAHLLQPDHPTNRLPITGTVGIGGGTFSGEDSDIGFFAGVGLRVHPQFSLNTAWSGVGLNVGASIVPAPSVPLTLNLLYGDVGNNTVAGSVAVVTLGYGFNFGPGF